MSPQVTWNHRRPETFRRRRRNAGHNDPARTDAERRHEIDTMENVPFAKAGFQVVKIVTVDGVETKIESNMLAATKVV